MRPFINLNGKFLPADAAAIPADARAFRYGYGLFETMLMRDGAIRLDAYHWERLAAGMTALRIDASPHFFKMLKDAVQKTAARNGHTSLARIRVQVWPSSGGYYDGGAFSAQFCIETFPLDDEISELNANGLTLGIAAGIVKSADAFSHIKSCSALPYALAARQAKDERWNDALLLNAAGNIADSTIANFFWIEGGRIFTPPLSEGCVAGVMRRHLLHLLPRWGYAVEEQPAPPARTFAEADAVFLTNAIRSVRWVGACAGGHFECGAVAAIHEELLRSFPNLR